MQLRDERVVKLRHDVLLVADVLVLLELGDHDFVDALERVGHVRVPVHRDTHAAKGPDPDHLKGENVSNSRTQLIPCQKSQFHELFP